MLLPFVRLSIDVKTCTSTQLPIIVLAFYSGTPGASIREYKGNTLFTCGIKESSLLGTSIFSTSKACEVKEDRDWGLRGGGGWGEDVELSGEGEGGRREFVLCEEASGSLVRGELFELDHDVLFEGR